MSKKGRCAPFFVLKNCVPFCKEMTCSFLFAFDFLKTDEKFLKLRVSRVFVCQGEKIGRPFGRIGGIGMTGG